MDKQIITIDGSLGEGGGQVLRTALSLSMITGQAFKIKNIRAKRNKPGLLRQHLTAVNAAQAISSAKVQGAELKSTELTFAPKGIQGGQYKFAIGSAGSCMLVLQTILPALWFADTPSEVSITGGTHNDAAPPADFLIKTWCPLLAQMGIQQSITIEQYGFYPAGGGVVLAQVTPANTPLLPLNLIQRGALVDITADILISKLPMNIGLREQEKIQTTLPESTVHLNYIQDGIGPGNVVMMNANYEHIQLNFCAFAKKSISAENVSKSAIHQFKSYCKSDAVADEYLADQLLLPMALAGSGSFTTQCISTHFETNVQIIQKFLPVNITAEQQSGNNFLITINNAKS